MAPKNDDNGSPEPITPEVVPAGQSALAIPDEKRLQEYMRAMHAEVSDQDPDTVADDIVARILASETLEEVFAPQAVEHARDLVGQPMTIQRAKVNQSDYEGGPGVYAIVEAVLHDDGRTTTFSCGGRNVLAQLYKAAQMGAIPIDVVLEEAPRPTKNGYRPLWLRLLGPADKVSGSIEREAADARS